MAALAASGNVAGALLIVLARGWDQAWVVALAGAYRICGIAWNIIDRRRAHDGRGLGNRRRRTRPREPAGSGRSRGRDRRRRTNAGLDRPGLDALVRRHALRHSHRTHEHRSDAAGRSIACRGRRRRHAHRRAVYAARHQPDLSGVARTDALDRASIVAPALRSWRRSRRTLARSRHRLVASLQVDDGHPDARVALFSAGGAQSRPAARPPDCRDPCGDRSGLGHELVLRYRKLGGRDVELLGRVEDRHLARGDGEGGAGRRRVGTRGRRASPLHRKESARATSRSSSSAIPARATPPSMSFAISC